VPRDGPNVTLKQTRKVLAAADAEARKQGWPVAITILDTAGNLVLMNGASVSPGCQRHDNTRTASVQVAQDKAVSAAIHRRPTKVFRDAVTQGGDGTRILGLRGAPPVEDGVTLTVDGKIIGAIGVSGVTSQQDGMVARADAEAPK